jgi:hypothetical protein
MNRADTKCPLTSAFTAVSGILRCVGTDGRIGTGDPRPSGQGLRVFAAQRYSGCLKRRVSTWGLFSHMSTVWYPSGPHQRSSDPMLRSLKIAGQLLARRSQAGETWP